MDEARHASSEILDRRAGGHARAILNLLLLALLSITASVAFSAAGTAQASPGWDLILDRPKPNFGNMDFVSDSEGWLVAGAGLLHTADGGASWQEIATIAVSDVDFVDAQHGFAVGLSGAVYTSNDGGATWAPRASGTEVHLSDVFTVSAQEAWTTGSGEGFSDVISVPYPTALLHTTDAGATWQSIATPANMWFSEVTFVGQQGWLLGAQCTQVPEGYCSYEESPALLHTSDGGATWSLLVSDIPRGARNLVFLSDLEGWVLGLCPEFCSDLKLHHTSDGGATWGLVTTGTGGSFGTLAFRSAAEGYATSTVCITGECILKLAKTSDGGATWMTSEVGPAGPGFAGSLAVTNTSINLTGWNLILHSADGGSSWHEATTPAIELEQVDFISTTTGFGRGRGRLYRTDDAGRNWVTVSGDFADYGSIDFVDNTRGFASRSTCTPEACELRLDRTVDGGQTWQTLNTPTLGDDYSVKLQFLDQNLGWLVTYNGTILTTNNGGDSWHESSVTAFGSGVVDADLADPEHAWAIVGGEGELYGYTILVHSSDGGEHWGIAPGRVGKNFSNLEFVDAGHGWYTAICEEPDCITNLVRTENGGATWSEHEVDFGRVSDLVFVDPLNGWVSGHNCGPGTCQDPEILHTADAGNTWSTQASGKAIGGQGAAFSFVDERTGWFLPGLQVLGFGSDPNQRTQLYLTTDAGGGPIGVEATPEPQLPDTGAGGAPSEHGHALRSIAMLLAALALGVAALGMLLRMQRAKRES